LDGSNSYLKLIIEEHAFGIINKLMSN
jgi:hypothetical protein